jgi:predicted methyltransferase
VAETGARKRPVSGPTIAVLLALCAACEPPAAGFDIDRAAITSAVANPDRLAADRERDPSSKPAEVLEFLGVAPGMRVLDMNAATGYYAELLARVVGPTGHVIAHNHPGALATLARESFERRYAGNRLPNAEQLFAAHNDLALPAASLDAVLMSMVYHDTYWHDPSVDWGPVDQHALLESLYRALAPGGIVGVIDHHAAPGTDPRESAKATHRIDAAVVRADFAAAGFTLEAESDALRNPADLRSRSVFDDAVRGRTDRFIMRFTTQRLPAALHITTERITPGREAEYGAIEEHLADACARLGCPNDYLALESEGSPKEVWWLVPYAQEADVDRVAAAYAANEPLLAELRAGTAAKKGTADEPASVLATIRPELGAPLPWRVGMDELVVIAEALAATAPASVFEAQDGRRFALTTAASRAEAHAIAARFGGRARVMSVRPSWSRPAAQWVAANPTLWSRR